MNKLLISALVLFFVIGTVNAADIVPTEIMQPGTQPREITNLETPDKCDNCHGSYDPAVEPAFNWRGSMMANAGRDPIFWATLAVAEQDFDGAGDLCIRCHSTAGWLAGRSTPTDGSGLGSGDGDGVECDFCHTMTDTNNCELLGVMVAPFIANNNDSLTCDPLGGYYGSGMASMWGGGDKLGPYLETTARHQFLQSGFHRSVDFCGTCHDVSNPAVGDLAPNNGVPILLVPGTFSGALGTPADTKAAFNNFPYMYGIVERTFSEYKSGKLSGTLVSDYDQLPADLHMGAIKAAYDSAIIAGTGGNYSDGTPRYFSCQTCHMRAVTGQGCNKNPPVRTDLPLHDQTGGNYWMPDAITYLDPSGKLRVGGGLTTIQVNALNEGKTRAMKQLSQAASLSVNDTILTITNLAGHKLISGYPEGRRMWLNIKWYNSSNELSREDGEYGPLNDSTDEPVTIPNPAGGPDIQVKSIKHLHPDQTDVNGYGKIYEAHYGMTKEWADKLMSINAAYYGPIVLEYDRYNNSPVTTISQLNTSPPKTYHETFHFVLNNMVAKDNRIPPYKMSYAEARNRNALPVPDDQYGNPGTGGTYDHWDNFTLNPPDDAVYATIDLLYQPTSWEYIQFLYLANQKNNPFLAMEGDYLLEAWLNSGMAEPYVMASTIWGSPPAPSVMEVWVDSLTNWSVDRKGSLIAQQSVFAKGDTVGIVAHTVDQTGANLAGSQVFMELEDARGTLLTSLQGFSGTDGNAVLTWKSDRRSALDVTASVANVLNDAYQYNATASTTTVSFSTV